MILIFMCTNKLSDLHALFFLSYCVNHVISCHRKTCRIATIKSSRPDCHPAVAVGKNSMTCPRTPVWILCARNVRNVSNSIIRKVRRSVPAI